MNVVESLINDSGQKYLIIKIPDLSQEWLSDFIEDIEDNIDIELRKNEESISFDVAIKELGFNEI